MFFLLVFFAFNAPILSHEPTETQNSGAEQRQTAQSFEIKEKLDYLLYLPSGYEPRQEKTDGKWPLLVFLHGAGERGNDLNKVKKHGPPKIVADDPDFPFVLISPQCPAGGFWNVDHLLRLIKTTITQRNIDPDRVYVTGLSMGGHGSWALAAEAPDLFAAVAPICGGGDPKNAKKLKDVPIWAFHGDADTVVPISASKNAVDAIKKAGGEKVKLTVYKGVGHDSWTETYANEALYKWFLSQRRDQR